MTLYLHSVLHLFVCSPSAWVSQVHPEHLASITLGKYFLNISTLYLSTYSDICVDVELLIYIFNLKYGLMFPMCHYFS